MGKYFPNGFRSWQETHFEVVQAIAIEWAKDKPTGLVAQRQAEKGHCGLYELAEELTDEFELKNKDRFWDGEFFEEIADFTRKKLHPLV